MPPRIFPALMSLFVAGFSTVFAADESTNKDGDWKLAVHDQDDREDDDANRPSRRGDGETHRLPLKAKHAQRQTED